MPLCFRLPYSWKRLWLFTLLCSSYFYISQYGHNQLLTLQEQKTHPIQPLVISQNHQIRKHPQSFFVTFPVTFHSITTWIKHSTSNVAIPTSYDFLYSILWSIKKCAKCVLPGAIHQQHRTMYQHPLSLCSATLSWTYCLLHKSCPGLVYQNATPYIYPN